MPFSITSVFGDPDDFQNALRNEGYLSLYITAQGRFLARLTTVELYRTHMVGVEEHIPHIGFLAVPPDVVLMSFGGGDRAPPIWGGIQPRKGEIIAIGPDHGVHIRTQGPCRWNAIRLPARVLAEHFHALTGRALTIPGAARLWRPPRSVGRRLLQLHVTAIRAAIVRPETIVDAEAAHGMEQQLIDVLVECLSAGFVDEERPSSPRHQDIAVSFEALLQTRCRPASRAADLAAALGISARLLHAFCANDLGMSPTSFIRLRALHGARSVLRNGVPGLASVSRVARCHGFQDPGHFAASYRALFGELPSATLRRTHLAGTRWAPRRRARLHESD